MPTTTGPLRPMALLIMLAFMMHLGLCLPGHHTGDQGAQAPSASVRNDRPGAVLQAPHGTARAAAHPQRPAWPYPEPAHARHGGACQTLNRAPAGLGMAVSLPRCVSGAACPADGPVDAASPDPTVTGTVVLTLLCVSRT
jgi:hypothetical protein